MSIPGYTKEESINTFLKALRDPTNRGIFAQIERALIRLGVSGEEIEYYKTTGRRLKEWNDFEDEMNEINTEFDNAFSKIETSALMAKKRHFSVILMATIFGVVFTVGILMSILIFSSADDSKSSDKTSSTITESAAMQDGDKL